MADEFTIKNEYEIATAGPCVAVCVDFINLGDCVEQYQNNAPHVVPKGALVFQIEETNKQTGKRFEPAVEKSLMFGNKAGLRKLLEAWRGRVYSDQEARQGAPLHKLVGQCGIITLEHKTSASSGKTYANIMAIGPLLRGMAGLAADNYERAEYWAKRKEEYAAKVREFYGTQSDAGEPEEGALTVEEQAALADLPF